MGFRPVDAAEQCHFRFPPTVVWTLRVLPEQGAQRSTYEARWPSPDELLAIPATRTASVYVESSTGS
jgi:hypothetical protein